MLTTWLAPSLAAGFCRVEPHRRSMKHLLRFGVEEAARRLTSDACQKIAHSQVDSELIAALFYVGGNHGPAQQANGRTGSRSIGRGCGAA